MSADIHRDAFITEAQELLEDLEQSLMELENTPDDADLIAKVFRAMHTVKGSGSMFGFDNIASFVHGIETAYDLVREGSLNVTQEMIECSLKSCDIVKEMINNDSLCDTDPRVAKLKKFFSSLQNAPEPKAAEQRKIVFEDDSGDLVTYRINFKPEPDILMRGVNIELLLKELSELGDSRVVVHTEQIPFLMDYDPEKCYLSWDIILTTDKGDNAIKDVFMFVEDDCTLTITPLTDHDLDNGTEYKKIGEILVERGDIAKDEFDKILNKRKRTGEILVESGLVPPDAVKAALEEQEHIKQVRAKKAETESKTSIRVQSEKLDELVDLVGELVTVQARLNQTASTENNAELHKIAEEVERLVWELRDNTMSIRMLPIGSTFNKFNRLVRDLSNNLGKKIELVTEGAETELDKTVIEKLNDPLVHLIRNSIDHGIEMPAERAAAGKKETGTILLSAKHSGDSVLIQIKDNGKGIDPEKIKEKAIEKGIIPENAELATKEACELIFAAGFSTAEQVSNISGRGVGMDVVKKNIESLRGTIDISSEKGKGTTIALKLPLTLAIIDGLLIRIHDQFFIIPLSVVEECIELTEKRDADTHGRNIIKVRGDLVPYIKLRELFGIREEAPKIQQIVITEIDSRRVGFVVDAVIGDHQTVIKSLGKAFKGVHGISGATILGDGSVALIIDIMKIYNGIE
jgi:two-component system chemotaxis sensor kinase CheA